MDRLICGDVGYGKTEVARRAAMRAVLDGKQVAVLAPTTVLAFQHWKTFRKRFAPFPVTVEMVSRFRAAREIKKVVADTAAGKVDVLVGTHRLLSRDVAFKDLGLLVIDEEQRFGVAAKERLKQLRTTFDALTLSATPIPSDGIVVCAASPARSARSTTSVSVRPSLAARFFSSAYSPASRTSVVRLICKSISS